MGHLITLGGLDLPNLEFHEQMYPVRYVRHEQRLDNAGAGAKRGGTGVRYEADILVPATWSFRAEGLDTASGYGVQGGMTGGVGLKWVIPVAEDAGGGAFVPPKYGRTAPRSGPRDRRHARWWRVWETLSHARPSWCCATFAMKWFSVAAAARDYGVVISADGRSIDIEATGQLRADSPG